MRVHVGRQQFIFAQSVDFFIQQYVTTMTVLYTKIIRFIVLYIFEIQIYNLLYSSSLSMQHVLGDKFNRNNYCKKKSVKRRMLVLCNF